MPHWEPVKETDPGVIAWDGLLLDGWRPLPLGRKPEATKGDNLSGTD